MPSSANCFSAVAESRMSKRTYLDSGVLIAACAGKDGIGRKALEILDDPSRHFVLSDAVKLEVLPKAVFEKRPNEVNFYEEIFSKSEELEWCIDTLHRALDVAKQYGIAAIDAVHVATALGARVDELVTTEKPTKPMFRVKEISIISIYIDVASREIIFLLIVSPFFAKPEMDPSDFRSKKLATGFAFGCPRSSCVRPVSVLRFATHSNRGYHK